MLFINKHIVWRSICVPYIFHLRNSETIQYSFNKTKEQVRKPMTRQKIKITYMLRKYKYTICKEIRK